MELKSSLSEAKEEHLSDDGYIEHGIVARRALWKKDNILIKNSPLLRGGEKSRAPEDRLETDGSIEGMSRCLGRRGRGEFKKVRIMYEQEDGTVSDPNLPLEVHQDEGGSLTPPSVDSYDESHSASGGLREEQLLASGSYKMGYLATTQTNYNRKNSQKSFYSREKTVPNYHTQIGLCQAKLKNLELKMNTMLKYLEKRPRPQRRTLRVQRTENISSSYQASKDMDMIWNREVGDMYEGYRKIYETKSEEDIHYSAARLHEESWGYPAFPGDGKRRKSLSQEESWTRRDLLNKTPPIVHCLRMLSILDVQLGTLGPKVVNLLSEALLLEKKNINESMKLLCDQKVYMFLETVKEKMRGLLFAGVLGGYLTKTCEFVITDIEQMLSRFPFHPESSSTSDSSLGADICRLVVERMEEATGQSGRQQLPGAPSGLQRKAVEVRHGTYPLAVSLTSSPSSTPKTIKKSKRKMKYKMFCEDEMRKMNNSNSPSRYRNKSKEGKRPVKPDGNGEGYSGRSSRTYYNSNRHYRRGEERRRQDMAEEWSRLKPWSAQQIPPSPSTYTPSSSYLSTEKLNNDLFYPNDKPLDYCQSSRRHFNNSSYGDLFFYHRR